MASFLTSIKRELNDDSEEVSESQDSFFRRDFDKLKEMLTNLKENKPKAEKNASFEDMTLSSETKGNLNRLITKERGLSEDYTDEARREKHHYEEEIANLRNKLEISETRLAKLQDFNSSLFKKLTTSENELKKCQEILSKREYLNQVKSLEIEDMNHKITSLSLANQAELEKLKQSYEILKKEMYEKQYEAIKFEQIIKDKDNQIRQLSEQLPEYTLEELENILKENKILREKITETEKSIDNLYMFKSNDSAILLEMDKLKSDIKRLIELLKSTDEFKEFAENAKLLNDDVRFLKNVHKEKGTNKNFKQWSEKRNLKSEFENYFWVPTDAFKFANDFRVKYQGHFTEELIESLLFEINKLWKDKHEKSLSKLKEKYELKLANLRQQYTSSNIQSSIVNQKMISRLKNQVQKSSKDLETLKKNKKIDGLEALNTTLKVATREHHRLKSLEMENKKLSSQLQSMVDSTVLSKHAKPEFIEGATWIYGKIKKELDGLIEICSDLIQDYEAKLQQILTEFPEREETNMILARSKWLIDGVETTLSSFYETVKNLEGQIVLPYATIGDYTSVNSILTKDYHS